MNIQPLHPNFKVPTRSTALAGGYDLYMPEAGTLYFGGAEAMEVRLGFAAQVPLHHVGLLLPRSGKGAKQGLSLNNTVGVIDPDYTGEWRAFFRLRNELPHSWQAGDRLLQLLVVPVATVDFVIVDSLATTTRGTGGFNSTGD